MLVLYLLSWPELLFFIDVYLFLICMDLYLPTQLKCNHFFIKHTLYSIFTNFKHNILSLTENFILNITICICHLECRPARPGKTSLCPGKSISGRKKGGPQSPCSIEQVKHRINQHRFFMFSLTETEFLSYILSH